MGNHVKKSLIKKEWFQLMILNIIVAIATLIVANAAQLGNGSYMVQVSVMVLSAVRMFNKTSQDKELIKNLMLEEPKKAE